MAELGSISLLVALALALYSAAGSVLGSARRVPRLVESARNATYRVTIALGLATSRLASPSWCPEFRRACAGVRGGPAQSAGQPGPPPEGRRALRDRA